MSDNEIVESSQSKRGRKRSTGDEQELTLEQVQGRPMLSWQGKRPLTSIIARPAQLTDTFDPNGQLEQMPANPGQWQGWPTAYSMGGLLFYGDNKDVLANLLANGFRGKVNLIYIDPPFDSGADYVRNVQLRGAAGLGNLGGEAQSPVEQKQYSDIWANDLYLQFMYERLMLLKDLLTADGSIYLHCDPTRSHHLRCLMDEVFGSDNFINEIAWKRSNPHGNQANRYGSIHDTIMFYTKGEDYYWDPQFDEHEEEYLNAFYRFVEPKTDRRYRLGPLNNFAGVNRPNLTYEWHGQYRTWRYTRERMELMEKEGRLVYSSSGLATQKLYLDEMQGVPPQDMWLDIKLDQSQYPTQKPEALLDRIILASCPAGGIVLDCFSGSGTTAAVAQKLGRHWIAADLNRGALQTTSRRLQSIIAAQAEAAHHPQQNGLAGIPVANGNGNGKKKGKNGNGNGDTPAPAQLAFTIHRVNYYKLDIPYDEAVDIAIRSVGATRSRTDMFFDGTRGQQQLVKVIGFDHPLGPLDLQLIKDELTARSEERGVLVVCYGRMQAADEWLTNNKKYRAVTRLDEHTNQPVDFVNSIEVIDLETDAKYGGFLAEQPPQAQVSMSRRDGQIVVKIDDFISPTIIKKLNIDVPLFRAKVTDWRSMVNSVEIDTNYDGEVFNIAASDIPERKNDLVKGEYNLPAPQGPTTVAVRITDMLGQDVIVAEKV